MNLPRPSCAARTLAALLMSVSIAGAALAHGDEDHSKDGKGATGATGRSAHAPQRQADGSLFIPKTVQRQLGLRTTLSEQRALAASLEFNGTVVADANASGVVQATQAGRVAAGPQGLPSLGQRVSKGQVLVILKPLSGNVERGNQLALLAEIDAQLALAANRVQRAEQLDGVLPRKEIESARIEHAALQRRREAAASTVQGFEALVAPVSGVISVAQATLGQVVDARDVLYEVVDPKRLAIQALAYDPAAVSSIVSASADAGGTPLSLRYVGSGRQLKEQALPLLFRIQGGGEQLALGQSVKVVAQTSRTVNGVAVPLAALMRSSAGEPIVWVHTQAEQFEARRVRHQRLSADTAVVVDGLQAGERVVTTGAALLSQVR